MRDIDASELLAIAKQFQGPPYDFQITGKLCDAAESFLTEIFNNDPHWSEYGYCLDGFVHTQIDKFSERFIVRGAMWLLPSSFQPCEVEIKLIEMAEPRVILRFGSANENVSAETPEKLRFPFDDWLCVHEVSPIKA